LPETKVKANVWTQAVLLLLLSAGIYYTMFRKKVTHLLFHIFLTVFGQIYETFSEYP